MLVAQDPLLRPSRPKKFSLKFSFYSTQNVLVSTVNLFKEAS